MKSALADVGNDIDEVAKWCSRLGERATKKWNTGVDELERDVLLVLVGEQIAKKYVGGEL